MKTRSAKAKGRKLQQEVVKKILDNYEQLTERDVRSAPMGTIGEDIVLSDKASKVFPYSVECKNTEKINIWSAIKQSECENRKLTPLLIFRRNFSDTYCTLKLDDFIKIIGVNNEEKISK